MKIVRTARAVDLRNIAIDGFDMYLLSRLEEPTSLDQLLAISPCEPAQAMLRVAHLAELGLVELRGSADVCRERAEDVDDNAPTLRPAPLVRDEPHAATSAIPPRAVRAREPSSVSEEAITLRPPPPPPEPASFGASAPSTGVRARPFAFTPRGVHKRGSR